MYSFSRNLSMNLFPIASALDVKAVALDMIANGIASQFCSQEAASLPSNLSFP